MTETAASTGVALSIQLIGGSTAHDNLDRCGRLRVIGTTERIAL